MLRSLNMAGLTQLNVIPTPNPSPLCKEGLTNGLAPPLYAVERGSGGEDVFNCVTSIRYK
jgi:hypothetical protein